MKILVIGDVMVDEYVYVSSTRNAPEATIPVWDQEGVEHRLGGAANVALNVRKLVGPDCEVSLCGILGLSASVRAWDIIRDNDIRTTMLMHGPTMAKTRYVSDGKIIFRHDNFKTFGSEVTGFFESIVCPMLAHSDPDVVIISDYSKGTVTEKVCDSIRDARLTVVDSKRADIRRFSGMNVLKINEHERDAQLSSPHYSNYTSMFEYCVVTKGAAGAELLQCEKTKSSEKRYVVHSEAFPTERVVAKDVTGCGDTFTAALACSLVKDRDIRNAIRFANSCATEVVQKFGTSTI